jgi:glycosyltransferase involved in cell wall biosynthesis
MRILILDNAPFLGGAQVNLRHLIPLLRERGCDVSITVATTADARVVGLYEQLGVTIDVIPMGTSGGRELSPVGVVSTLRALRTLIKRHQADVIFASSRRAGALSAAATAIGLVRSVWRLCDMGVPVTRKLMTVFVSRATCVSEAVYRSYEGLPRGRFRVVHTGVWAPDNDAATVARRRREYRSALGIPENARVIGAVCNLQHWKGLHIVLEAFRLLLREEPDAFLVHIGGPVPGYPDYPSRIDDLIERWDLTARVRRLGYVIDPLPYYSAFDVFAHLPVPEGAAEAPEAFGQVAAEAMAYRVPVVASRLGGLTEVVNKSAGVLIAPGSAEEAAAGISMLLRDDALRAAMGQDAFERYRQLFTIEREADDYVRIFRELA